jgi:DNA-3-methyladenine glycosylase
VHRTDDGDRVGRIVETEAYGADDPANHAFRGPTRRNRSMFQGPGTLYLYRIHQVYCANAVTRPGEAVLLRAAAPLSDGLGSARGPGRLCRAFGLDLEVDGSDLRTGPVRLLPTTDPAPRIVRGPRVGISKANERPWRFAIAGAPEVSLPRLSPRRRA